jgi:hypothetical protein
MLMLWSRQWGALGSGGFNIKRWPPFSIGMRAEAEFVMPTMG